MLEGEATDGKHGWEAEVQPDKGEGGGTGSASGKDGEGKAVGRQEMASVSEWDSVPGGCLWGVEEVSDRGGLEFSSLCGVITLVLLQAS